MLWCGELPLDRVWDNENLAKEHKLFADLKFQIWS